LVTQAVKIVAGRPYKLTQVQYLAIGK
jgi:hypothetical protein